MAIPLFWSNYGADASFASLIPGYTPDARPTDYYAALFTDTANPDGGPTPTEVTDGAYSRQAITLTAFSTLVYRNNADLVWPAMVGVFIFGVALMDDPTAGEAWMWANLTAPLSVSAGLRISSGDLVTLIEDFT